MRVKFLCLLALICFLFCQNVHAQLQESALKQIQSLIEEKESRTPAQKKISSQLIYASKMDAGLRITPEVATLETGITKDAEGKVKVELDATVTNSLITQLETEFRCRILFSSEKFGNILALVPLANIERIAALDAVRHIIEWMAPMNNSVTKRMDNFKTATADDFNYVTIQNKPHTATVDYIRKPDLTGRLQNVRNFLTGAFNKTGVPENKYFAGTVVSEADVTHKAALARTVFGTDGTGVKIGVISNGVDFLATSQAAGELPAVTVLPGQAGTGNEGTAMLELIHDLAPGAQLYYATALSTEASFAQNILDLRTAGCDIIVDDVTYFKEGVFQDDVIARAVNSVTASGAMYFSSAGNSGNKNDNTSGVWEGDFVSGGASVAPIPLTGDLHDFGGSLFNIQTLVGSRLTLKWSDPLLLSGNDYDLFRTNSLGTVVTASSTNIQDGNDDPYEFVIGGSSGERVYILKKTGAATRALHLNTNRGTLSINTSGVTYGHNAGNNAICVAATPAYLQFTPGYPTGPYPGYFNSSNTVELFSSDGLRKIFFNPDGTEITPGNLLFGTNGGNTLQKPDLTAADGTVTSTSGFLRFYGTSAAAPHAAAIAALIKSKLPALTAAQIKAALINSAIDIEAPGVDRDAGAGIIMATSALVEAGATAPAYLARSTVTAVEGSFSNNNGLIEPGEMASITVLLENPATTSATTVVGVLSTTTPGVTITQNTGTYNTISGLSGGVNTGSPYIFGINSSVPCGRVINFTLTVTYLGGGVGISPQTFNFSITAAGPAIPTISGVIGSAAPTGTGFTSTTGTQTGRVNRDGVIPTCASPKASVILNTSTGSRAYHAYTFNNTSTISQCVTVSVSTANPANIYEVVYNNSGFVPTSTTSNYLADQGTTTNVSPFSFNAPPGQQFTVVVHEVNPAGATGQAYDLNVDLRSCSAPPACPVINITPLSLPSATIGSAYNQTISASGGNGSYTYTLSGALPTGLSFSNGVLSGTPSQTGNFPITVTAEDVTGCTGSRNYTLTVQCPTITVTNPVVNSVVEGNPFSESFVATGGSGSYTYSTSGTLPTGITLSSAGLLSGTSNQIGVYPIVVVATDQNNCTGSGSTYSLNITPFCTGLDITSNTHSISGVTSNWINSTGQLVKVKITAKGSRGGNSDFNIGGYGAVMSGEFFVASGQTVDAIAGSPGDYNRYSGSGGGGSGAKIDNNILIVAGAGGGAGNGGTRGQDGVTTINGTDGVNSVNIGYSGAGGQNGNGGGGGGYPGYFQPCSGGGGGYLTTGGTGANGFALGGGYGFNAFGGTFTGGIQYRLNGGGGFGGGGAAVDAGGGGGGGYSGGGGSAFIGGGGGGGSINKGSNQNNSAGSNSSGGQVSIECLGAATFNADFTPVQPTCLQPTVGSLNINLTGDIDGITNGLEYAIVSGNNFSGLPTFSPVTSDPFSITSGFGTAASLAGSVYTIRLRLIYNPSVFLDYTYTLINPGSDVNAVSDLTVCNNETVNTINFSGTVPGTLFIWTNNNTSIGLAANGTGDISSFNAINSGTSITSAVITVTPYNPATTCSGTPVNFTINVKPTPTVSVLPKSQTICSNVPITPIVLSGTVNGTNFSWSRDNTGSVTGISQNGSGDISGILINNTTSPITVTFTITPIANGCQGPAETATVTVNPCCPTIPNVNVTPIVECEGSLINFSSTGLTNMANGPYGISYKVFNGTTADPYTGGNLVGTVPYVSLTAGASSASLGSNSVPAGNWTVYAVLSPTPSDPSCRPFASTTLTINPIPNAIATPNSQTVCSGDAITNIVLTGNVPGTVYNWTRDKNAEVTGIAASGSGNIAGNLTNTLNTPVTVTFMITPVYTNAGKTCTGTPITATVTVKPTSSVSITGADTYCGGSTATLTATAGFVSYSWSLFPTNAILGSSQTLPVSKSGSVAVTVINGFGCPSRAEATVQIGDYVFTGGLNAGNQTTGNRLFLNGVVSTCAATKPCQVSAAAGPFAYNLYSVTNPNPNAVCATISVSNVLCSEFLATSVYLGSFNPANICANLIADNGNGVLGGTIPLEVIIPGGATIIVRVSNTTSGSYCTNYQVVVDIPRVPAAITTTPDVNICAGSPATLTASLANAYSWSPGGATTSSITVSPLLNTTYTVTLGYGNSGCTSAASQLITVKPIPDAVANVNTQTICSGSSIAPVTFSGSVPGTLYTWSRDNTGITPGMAANGTGDISGVLNNITNTPQTVTFTITPSANGCSGTPITVTVIVNPVISGTANPLTQTVCSGTPVSPVNLGSNVNGTTFTWTRNNPAITGIPMSGSGNNITGILTNNGAFPVTVTFTIIPSYTNAGKTCTGDPITASITVNPVTTGVINGAAISNICAGQNGSVAMTLNGIPTFNGVVKVTNTNTNAQTQYNWSQFGGSGNMTLSIPAALLPNTGATQVNYLIEWISLSDASGCAAQLSGNATIAVNPGSTVTVNAPATVCPGTNIVIGVTGTGGAGTFSWNATAANGATLSNSSGILVPFSNNAINTNLGLNCSNLPGINPVTFNIIPQGGFGCFNQPVSVQVNIIDVTAPQLTGVLPLGGAQGNFCLAAFNVPTAATIQSLFTDNCGALHSTVNVVSTGTDCNWTKVATYNIADACNNTTTVSITYTGGDTGGPTFTPAAGSLNRTIEYCDQAGLAAAQALVPAVTDNCSAAGQITVVKTAGQYIPGSCATSGTIINTFTATDACGNTSVFNQGIIITDNTGPIISGIQNQTLSTGGGCSGVLPNYITSTGITATDCSPANTLLPPTPGIVYNNNNTGNLNIWQSPAPGTTVSGSTQLVTISAMDACGNLTTQTFTVTIIAGAVPQFTNCPQNLSVTTAAPNGLSGCRANVSLPQPSFIQNCTTTQQWTITGASPNTSVNGNFPASYIMNLGVTTVTYRLVDANGNSATCSFTVTVTSTLNATVTGTTSAVQNVSTSTPVTFTGLNGTAPYTFTYDVSVNGGPFGAPQTVSTASNQSTAVVQQSNASTGFYTYRLLQVSDASGCSANIGAPNTAVITVVPIGPATPDLTSSQFFSTTQIPAGGIIDLVVIVRNVGSAPTSGPIVINFTNYSALTGLTLSQLAGGTNVLVGIDTYLTSTGWIINMGTGTITTNNIIPAGGSNIIGLRITRGTGANAGANGAVTNTITIPAGTGGGESPSSNNTISNSILKN